MVVATVRFLAVLVLVRREKRQGLLHRHSIKIFWFDYYIVYLVQSLAEYDYLISALLLLTVAVCNG